MIKSSIFLSFMAMMIFTSSYSLPIVDSENVQNDKQQNEIYDPINSNIKTIGSFKIDISQVENSWKLDEDDIVFQKIVSETEVFDENIVS